MMYKKIISALLAFCFVAVPFGGVDFAPAVVVSSAADKAVNLGTINLDNEKPAMKVTLSAYDNLTEFKWGSSDVNVAIVEPEGGDFNRVATITAVGKGSCTIRAVNETGEFEFTVISTYEEKEAAKKEIDIGNIVLTNKIISKQIKFDAPDGVEIKYSSSDESVATVSDDGTVTAKGMGKCTIYAEIGDTLYYANVTSVYTGEQPGTLVLGEVNLTADSYMQTINLSGIELGDEVEWSSSDEGIAVVSKGGTVTGVSEGSCKIYAETNGKTYSIDINVSFNIEDVVPVFNVSNVGDVIILSFDNISSDAVFTSADETIATVNNSGVVQGVGEGTTTIKVESYTGITWVKIKVGGGSVIGVIGDANMDGRVNIADATAIIQHIANPDKYGLSEQGLINADVDGEKGVTPKDAYVLQLLEAGSIDSIPLEK